MLDGDAHQLEAATPFASRQVSDGEQVVHLEIGNDNGGAVFQDPLALAATRRRPGRFP